MKKMFFNFLLKPGLNSLRALAFAVFFLAGMGTVSAQYLERGEALLKLEEEISILLDLADNTTDLADLSVIHLKKNYYLQIFEDIDNGATVDAAIHDNVPSGTVIWTFDGQSTGNDPEYKTALSTLVADTEEMLSE